MSGEAKPTKRTLIIVNPSASGRRFCTSLVNKIYYGLAVSDEVVIRFGENKITGLEASAIIVFDEAPNV